jgi:hypothetical protein
MSKIEVGNLSESIVMAAYIKAGFSVSVPFGNGCAYDLVIDTGTRLYKVQVKTGWKRKGCLAYKGRRRIKDSSHDGMRSYRADEVDFFVIYFPPADAIYVMPSKVATGDRFLRLDPVLNGQHKLIRWAADYTWEEHVETLRESEFAPFMQISK